MDLLFYWGEIPLEEEIQMDVALVLGQPKNELFYNRAYGSGIPEIENSSSQILRQVGARFSAVQAIADRNNRVSDGTNGPDRRVITSQSIIDVIEGEGSLEIEVRYTPLFEVQRPQTVRTPIGGII